MSVNVSELDYKGLAAYLVEGVTWGRLKAIATQTPAEGGLGLFTESSHTCNEFFSTSPSAIIKSRPETDHTFLEFLTAIAHIVFACRKRLAPEDLNGA